MAEVFLAQQRGLEGFDRRVAVKRILPHLADAPDFVKMFLGEAKLAAALSHPNIVHIYDFGKHDGDYFLAMEFVDGVHAGDLFRLAEKDEKLPPALVARIGADAATALHHAHELRGADGKTLGLVHRDVSPANIMVSYDGVAKLCDFGIAKAAALGEQMTSPGQVKGKYAYMSPEQTVAAPLDGRSDVFSLAIVLWELLAGRTIVGRTDAVESMRAIRDGKLVPIDKIAPRTPSGLAKALNWALQTDRENRATPLQFANALEAYIKSSPDLATPLHLGMWIRARFPRQLDVASPLPADIVARASGPGKRPSATQIVDGTVQAEATPMPPVDGLPEVTEDQLDRNSLRDTADLREHLRGPRGVELVRRPDSLARPIDSLEQHAPMVLPDTPQDSRDSLGSISRTEPLERHSDHGFDAAATVSVTDDAPPMYLRDGGSDPFAPDKETEVDEVRPEVPWNGFEPDAGAHATHPQRNPRPASRAQSPAAPLNLPASSRAPSSPSTAPPTLPAPPRSPTLPPPRSPTLPPPRTSTLPPPHRANTPTAGARQMPQRVNTGAEIVERNAESVEMIPMPPTDAAAAMLSLDEPATTRSRAPSIGDGIRPRSPTINPVPLPPRPADAPLIDPAYPFRGDESGELVVAPRVPTASPAALPPSMSGRAPSMVSSLPGPAEHAPYAPPQPSRRTVAIGGIIAAAVVVFAASLAIRSCHEHRATNGATTGSASGAGSAGSGSATRPRPTVEPIKRPTVEPITE
jgi:serine/threonine protein kinase